MDDTEEILKAFARGVTEVQRTNDTIIGTLMTQKARNDTVSEQKRLELDDELNFGPNARLEISKRIKAVMEWIINARVTDKQIIETYVSYVEDLNGFISETIDYLREREDMKEDVKRLTKLTVDLKEELEDSLGREDFFAKKSEESQKKYEDMVALYQLKIPQPGICRVCGVVVGGHGSTCEPCRGWLKKQTELTRDRVKKNIDKSGKETSSVVSEPSQIPILVVNTGHKAILPGDGVVMSDLSTDFPKFTRENFVAFLKAKGNQSGLVEIQHNFGMIRRIVDKFIDELEREGIMKRTKHKGKIVIKLLKKGDDVDGRNA